LIFLPAGGLAAFLHLPLCDDVGNALIDVAAAFLTDSALNDCPIPPVANFCEGFHGQR
jgi:hypothetical protein